MKFPLSWLRRYLDTDADASAISEALTRLGLEVEGIDNPADRLRAFTIARVLTAAPHPQADRLQLLSVDTGRGDPVQVVCGAPNAQAGLVGVFAAPGTYVPGIDVTLKVTSIRGVESSGMMCSAREMQLGEDHEGIIELAADAPIGSVYAEWAGLDDPVFDIAITPNRQDCMGVYGIARDLAAAGLGTLKPINLPAFAADAPPILRPVAIEDPEGCPAFYARSVSGVTNGPSPSWLQDLLTKAGMRPISALVDITNYLTIGHGRPLHVYDVAKLDGGLTARRAKDSESVLALNGKTYALDESMTVIADDRRVHDIAGIMGGEDSGVADSTTDIVIEAAWFSPAHVGETGRTLGLTSDARARFERGVDPDFIAPGLDLAAAMIHDLCGGTVSAAMHVGTPPAHHGPIAFDPALTRRLGGIDIDTHEQQTILERLGFTVSATQIPWQVQIPGWRRDVTQAADLVEEVIRLHGIDKVQSVALPRPDGVARPTRTIAQKLEGRLRRAAAARGLDEAITWSFIAADDASRFGEPHWQLENPLSAELAVMRPSLLPGLLAAARRNDARGQANIRLFEIGRRYLADAEHPTLALLLAGDASARDWRHGKPRPVDVFDIKAEVMALLAVAGVPVDRLQTQQPAAAHYHPGRSARLVLGKAVLAEFGELHPDVLGDIGQAMAAEIYLAALPERRARRTRPVYAPAALQPVERDFAFLVSTDVAAEQLLRAIRNAEKELITDVSLFDRFTGTGVPEGQVSLAISITLQPRKATLTEADLERVHKSVVAAVSRFGAILRG